MTAKKNKSQDPPVPPSGAPPAKTSSGRKESGELNKPQWSVISFQKREARGLTYDQALEKISQLQEQGFSGLCIVTDRAAAKITRKRR